LTYSVDKEGELQTAESKTSGIDSRLRAARERLGWNRETLAFHSGMSWSAIAQVESGRRRNVRPSTLSALSSALGVTIDYLVSGEPAGPPMLEHRALLYRDDEEFLATAGPFLAEGMERSEALLVATTEAKIELLRDHLGTDARGVDFADPARFYRAPDAAVDTFMSFASGRIGAGAAWTRIIAEPIWAGRSDSEIRQWMRCEALINLTFAGFPMTMMCPYDESSVDPEIMNRARLTHPHMVRREGIESSPEYADPGGLVLEG
jgi:transcriptional regulator with XRE-family HTH domain